MGSSGVPNVIFNVIKSQAKTAKFFLIVFNEDDYYYPLLSDFDVTIIKLLKEKPKNKFLRFWWHFFGAPRYYLKECSKIISKFRIDVIHSFKEEFSWPFLKAGLVEGVDTRIVHCNNEYNKKTKFFPNALFNFNVKRMRKYANVFVGVSERCCQLAYPNKDYRVIYNTFDNKLYGSFVKNDLKDNELVLTHIATFSTRKNQLFTLEIIKYLVCANVSVKLNLVGFPVQQDYYSAILKYVKDNSLHNYVNLIDGSSGIGNILNKTTFLMLPSISEAAPLTLVEAQACGIECLASDLITREMNCGGVFYLPIDKGPSVWGDFIIERFNLKKNTRTKYDVSKFDCDTFRDNIAKLYL